jgi:hypothetical protein
MWDLEADIDDRNFAIVAYFHTNRPFLAVPDP